MNQSVPFGDYDPQTWLERSGILFLQHQSYSAAIESFTRLAQLEPSYAMAWYGLANALLHYFSEVQDIDLLRESVSYAKHALIVDPDNQFAKELTKSIVAHTPLTLGDVEAIDEASCVSHSLREKTQYTQSTIAAALDALPTPAERMQIVMWLGSLNYPDAIEILVRGTSDADPHVCMATLKRLGPQDCNDSRIQKALQSLAQSSLLSDIEPYLTMALKRFSSTGNKWAIETLSTLEGRNG